MVRRRERKLEIVSDAAVWYHAGMPPAPICWVLVRDPSGRREPQAFLSTNLDADPRRILGRFVSRWRMEITFQEARAHLRYHVAAATGEIGLVLCG